MFVPMIDIGSRPTSAIVFSKEGVTRRIPCELCSRLDGLLDALDWQATEVGAKSFKIGSSLGSGALMNATFQEIRHIVAGLAFLKFSLTLMNDKQGRCSHQYSQYIHQCHGHEDLDCHDQQANQA